MKEIEYSTPARNIAVGQVWKSFHGRVHTVLAISEELYRSKDDILHPGKTYRRILTITQDAEFEVLLDLWVLFGEIGRASCRERVSSPV